MIGKITKRIMLNSTSTIDGVRVLGLTGTIDSENPDNYLIGAPSIYDKAAYAEHLSECMEDYKAFQIELFKIKEELKKEE